MERIACEVCNSDHIIKDGEYFICESCGARYRAEDLRKMVLGSVEVIPGEKTLEKYYDDASFYMSINKYEEAMEVYQKIAKDYPKEYKPWLEMMNIQLYQYCVKEELLPSFEETCMNDALLRDAPKEEVEEFLYSFFNRVKAIEEDEDIIPEYYGREDFSVTAINETTTLIKMVEDKEGFYIYVPKDFKIYKKITNWFYHNFIFFLITANKIGCQKFKDECIEYRNQLREKGVFLYLFQNHFFSTGLYNYATFMHKHNTRYINGEEAGAEHKYDIINKHLDHAEDVEFKRDLDVRKLYLDLLDETNIHFETEAKEKYFHDPEYLREFFGMIYIIFDFVLFNRSKFANKNGFGYYMCVYMPDTDIYGKRINEYKMKYIDQRKKAKENGVCPWCGEEIDYSVLPCVCTKCRTRVEDIGQC